MQSKEDVTTHRMERLDGRVARRDASRMARRWWTQQAVEAISRLEAGALLEPPDFEQGVPTRRG